MNCIKCDAYIPDGKSFCPKCGHMNEPPKTVEAKSSGSIRGMKFRERLRLILAIKESPRKMATAFAIGVFIGMSPLIGIHTVLGLLAAWLFRLNRLITLVGVFVTNPWTIVPIYSFGTWFGAKIIGMNNIIPDIDWNEISLYHSPLLFFKEFRPLLLPFIIGSTTMGIVSAILSYFIIYYAVKKYRG